MKATSGVLRLNRRNRRSISDQPQKLGNHPGQKTQIRAQLVSQTARPSPDPFRSLTDFVPEEATQRGEDRTIGSGAWSGTCAGSEQSSALLNRAPEPFGE